MADPAWCSTCLGEAANKVDDVVMKWRCRVRVYGKAVMTSGGWWDWTPSRLDQECSKWSRFFDARVSFSWEWANEEEWKR